MTDIVIKQESSEPEKKPDVQDVKETLKAADEYQKLKEENDKLEAEYLRQQELKSRIALGGRSEAGQPEKTQADKDKEEAERILGMFK